jgi:hypothetical protein
MKDYLLSFEKQCQEAKTFENVLLDKPTKPTKLAFVGFVGNAPDTFSKVLAVGTTTLFSGSSVDSFEGTLPSVPSKPTKPYTNILARNLLNRILTPKPCRHCSTPMTRVEAGYFSCPECHYQCVEAKSGFWYNVPMLIEANEERANDE